MSFHGDDAIHGPETSPRASGAVRCFAAVFLETESASRLEALAAERLDGRLHERGAGRRVPAERYHVTLKFFGEIQPAAVADALAAVTALNGHPVAGAVTGLSGFPRTGSARLVAAELAANAQLEAWWAVLGARFGAEHRRFRPHVTVLRLRRPRTVARVLLPDPLPVTLAAPRLYRSDPTPDGARYRPLGPA